MLMAIDDIQFHLTIKQATNETDLIVLLHGFAGTGEVFNDLSEVLLDHGISSILIDLPGHGKTVCEANPKYFTIESQVYHLRELLKKISATPFWLYGYSMGGRIATKLATDTNLPIKGLILESAQLGITDETERKERVASDKTLSKRLTNDPAGFFNAWNRLPLFSSGHQMESAAKLKLESIQRSQDPGSLALSLENMSPGLIPPTSPLQLQQLEFPVLVITGTIDQKYDVLWAKLSSEYSHIDHIRIPFAGHRIHIDQPGVLSKELIHYIQSKN